MEVNPSLGAQLQEEVMEEEVMEEEQIEVRPEVKEEEPIEVKEEEQIEVKEEEQIEVKERTDGASTPSCGEERDCDEAAYACPIRTIQTQIQVPFLQKRLAHMQDPREREHLSTLVHAFLSSSQPLFTYLESRARSRLRPRPAGPTLLELSQQLCERLEQLVLNYAKQGLLSVDESRWDSLSHLYIGQCQIDGLKVSVFRYHAAAPFLSGGGAQPGLYKRMRWNVERLSDDRLHPHLHLHYHHHHQHQQQQQQQEEEEPEEAGEPVETGGNTEYFFMCYEDVPKGAESGIRREEEEGLTPGSPATRMWSIGRWVQTLPNPDLEDICDWVLCEVPQARYLKLVSLGSEEPSIFHATDCLLGLLFPQQT